MFTCGVTLLSGHRLSAINIAIESSFGITTSIGTIVTDQSFSKFILAGYNPARSITTTDGTNYTSIVNLPLSTNATNSCYGSGIYVIIATGTNLYTTSTDGINWTQRTLPVSANWFYIAYGNGMFMIVPSSASVYATSTDGINWTQRILPGSSTWKGLVYGNGMFVLNTVASYIVYGDGINMGSNSGNNSPYSNYHIGYGNGLFVVPTNGISINTSSDAITWTQRTLPLSGSMYSLAYGNGVYVGAHFNSSVALTSTDGITWTQRTLPVSELWHDISFGNGIFILISVYGVSLKSTDGINWTQVTMPIGEWRSITYAG